MLNKYILLGKRLYVPRMNVYRFFHVLNLHKIFKV